MQIMIITGLWLLGTSMGIDVSLSYYYVFFTIGWVVGAIPVSVGGAVVVEGAIVIMFTKFAIILDKDVNVQDLSEVALNVFGNTDPRRDMMFVDGPLDILDHASPHLGLGSKVGVDATRKWRSEGFDRDWPQEIEMTEEIRETVTKRWAEYGLAERLPEPLHAGFSRGTF